MTLMQLKDFIINKTIPEDFMIFVCPDNHFLAKQYLTEISEQKTGKINNIKSIYEPLQNTLYLLTDQEDALNVLVTETFDEKAEDYSQFTNTIVICDKIDKFIESVVTDFIIDMPKFQSWQIEDYVKTFSSSLDPDDIKWLVESSKGDIYRVLNEIDKVLLFDKDEQRQLLSEIRSDPQSDLYNFDLFKIVNAFVDGDMPVLYDFLRRKDFDTLEPIMLSNRILSSLKNILLITQNPTVSAEDLGVSPAQQRAIKYKYKTLNIEAVKHKIKFLASIDLDLKSSKLDLSKQDLMNYLVTHLCIRIA